MSEYILVAERCYRHARHIIRKLTTLCVSYLRAGASEQSNQELRTIKGRPPINNYGCGARPILSSPVLLSGSTVVETSGKPSSWLPLGKLVEQAGQPKFHVWSTTTNTTTNVGGSITLHKMKLQTCRAQKSKANSPSYIKSLRERIPTEQ